MRRLLIALALVAVLVAPAEAQSGDRVVRTFSQNYDRAGHSGVIFELNVGEMEVTGTSSDTIRAEVRIQCARGRDRDKCEEQARDVELNSYERRGRLYVEVEGTGLWRSRTATVHVILSVPEDMPTQIEVGTGELTVKDIAGDVDIEMNIGELTVDNVRGNVAIDMGIGEVSVTMPQDAVGEVTLDNGVGETELRHRDGRNAVEGILGGTDVHWNSGTGPSSVNVELNVGEIRVRLR